MGCFGSTADIHTIEVWNQSMYELGSLVAVTSTESRDHISCVSSTVKNAKDFHVLHQRLDLGGSHDW